MSANERFFLYFYCSDLVEMREFYSAKLGLDEVFYSAGPDGGLGYHHGGVQLTILPTSNELEVDFEWHRQPGWEGGEKVSVSWSIQLGQMDHFRAAVGRLLKSDTPCFHAEPQWLGYWSFPAKDPMGNTVELTIAPNNEPVAKTWQGLELANPETHWVSSHEPRTVTAEEVRERIGEVNEPYEVLGGGHANTNVRMDDGRILRIYRRDRSAARKEQSLLNRPWTTLRVPAVLDSGEDFLVLEYVEHTLLEGSPAHGEAVGQALAEIHQQTFEQAGFLGTDGSSVVEPFGDLVGDFCEYVASCTGVASEVRDEVNAVFEAHHKQLEALAERPVLLHGDFKVSNLHWTADARPLVLDWEFAYAGPALLDVGQLIRWRPPKAFVNAFADAYRSAGGSLPADWRRWAEILDLVNLVGLLDAAPLESRCAGDVRQRIRATLEAESVSPG